MIAVVVGLPREDCPITVTVEGLILWTGLSPSIPNPESRAPEGERCGDLLPRRLA
jgi:hypothetical protein